MNPINTALHRILGLPARPIEYDDVASAASGGLGESGELDWKRELPSRDKAAEFAKDVAAFANAAGGVLIYGVENTGHIRGLKDADIKAEIERLQRHLAAYIRPYLTGVQYQTLTNADNTLLLVHVPPSAAAPHLVYEEKVANDGKRAVVVPLRVNVRTEWMDERQLAEAYRRRFELTGNRLQHLHDLADFANEQMSDTARESAWITFAATPAIPERRDEIPRHEVHQLATSALGRTSEMLGYVVQWGSVLRSLSPNTIMNPRVGLRSWVASNALAEADRNNERPVYLEVHHDGSTVLSVNASWGVNNEAVNLSRVVSSQLVDDASAEFIALASLVAGRQAPTSELLMQASVAEWSLAGDTPFAAIDTSVGRNLERQWSRRVPRVRPVTTSLLPFPDLDDLRLVAHELASGVINQFGLESGLGRPAAPNGADPGR